MLLYPQLVSLNNRILHAHVLESAGDLLGEAGHTPQTKQLDRPLEAVGVGGLEEVEVRVPGHSDALQHDHGPGDEGEVVRYEEGVGVEDLVQVEGHGPELLPPALDGFVGEAALDLVTDRQLGRVEHTLQDWGQGGLGLKGIDQ